MRPDNFLILHHFILLPTIPTQLIKVELYSLQSIIQDHRPDKNVRNTSGNAICLPRGAAESLLCHRRQREYSVAPLAKPVNID